MSDRESSRRGPLPKRRKIESSTLRSDLAVAHAPVGPLDRAAAALEARVVSVLADPRLVARAPGRSESVLALKRSRHRVVHARLVILLGRRHTLLNPRLVELQAAVFDLLALERLGPRLRRPRQVVLRVDGVHGIGVERGASREHRRGREQGGQSEQSCHGGLLITGPRAGIRAVRVSSRAG